MCECWIKDADKWWLVLLILATQEVEIGDSSLVRQKILETPSQ
jgi:hypothetical protein